MLFVEDYVDLIKKELLRKDVCQYLQIKNNYNLEAIDDALLIDVIESYFYLSKPENYKQMSEKFREKYIYNESELELAHTKSEKQGLATMYDAIMDDEETSLLPQNTSVFTICILHQKLMSKMPYPEAGGKFRTDQVYLPKSGVTVTYHKLISKKLNELFVPVNELIKEGVRIHQEHDVNALIPYINQCIKLKCDLIKIHPFWDGNGRTIRGLISLLFKFAGIPPIYILESERTIYHKAMNQAHINKDYSLINKFYYSKICDTILQLEEFKNLNVEEYQKVLKK